MKQYTCAKCNATTPLKDLIQDAKRRKQGVTKNLRQCQCGSVMFITIK